MLTISGLRNFYFLPNMTDMRCGYNRIMEIVRTVYGRDPYDGDVYFYMSKNQRTVRMVNFEHHQYCVHTYTFDKGYRFMRIVTEGYKRVYKVEWKDVLAILESPELSRQLLGSGHGLEKRRSLQYRPLGFAAWFVQELRGRTQHQADDDRKIQLEIFW